MKIAMVFDGLGWGGIERVGIDYIRLILELGHTVDVYNLNPNLTVMESEMPENVNIHHITFNSKMAPETYRYGVKKWWWGKFAYPVCYIAISCFDAVYRLMKKNRKEKYDIAIAFSGHFNDLTFVSKGFVKCKNKLCWLHGALYKYIIMTDGFLSLYEKIQNLVVLVSEGEEEVYHYNKWLKVKTTKMYNPISIAEREIDEEKVNALKKEYGKFLIMVARFSYPHKDHKTVIDAVKVLKEKYGQDIKIVFVGNGESEERMKAYALELGMDSNVIFAGAHMDVQNYYAASHMLVHASVAGEGLPTIMMEAMAFGKPMVVTDSKVGPREILGNDEYGLLCRVQDPEDMARQINRILTDKDLYEHYQNQGYVRLKDFEPNVIKEQLNNLLQTIDN